MTRISIATDGTVRGLWTDDIDWRSLGPVAVRRASHVEFWCRRQMWFVRRGRPRGVLRMILQAVFRRPCGEILHWTVSRADALKWEAVYFGVGGPEWMPIRSPRANFRQTKKTVPPTRWAGRHEPAPIAFMK